MSRDIREDLGRELVQVKLALETIDKQRDTLSEEQFQAIVKALQDRYEALETQILSLSGSVATGQGAVAAGAGGVAVGGDVVASIYVGRYISDSRQALLTYLNLLRQTSARLPVSGIDIGMGDRPSAWNGIGLSNVYVGLNTTSQARRLSQRLGTEEESRSLEENRLLDEEGPALECGIMRIRFPTRQKHRPKTAGVLPARSRDCVA
jgi:hypothetical protein